MSWHTFSAVRPRKSWLLIALLVLSLSTAVLLQIPASLVAQQINQQCAGHCRLAQPRGHWWSGEAMLFLRSTANSDQNSPWLDLGPVAWSLEIGYPSRLPIRHGDGRLLLEARWDRITVIASQLAVPATWLLSQPALGLPAGGWSGKFLLRELKLDWQAKRNWQSQGLLDWQEAASTLLPDLPPENLTLEWQADAAQGGQARLATPGSQPVAIAGQLRFGPAARPLDFEASITPDKNLPNALARQLASVSRPDPAQPGRYLFKHAFR